MLIKNETNLIWIPASAGMTSLRSLDVDGFHSAKRYKSTIQNTPNPPSVSLLCSLCSSVVKRNPLYLSSNNNTKPGRNL